MYAESAQGKEWRMTVQIEANKVLDCTDLLCPIPVIKTSQAIKEIEVGEILHMIATDPGAPPDMEAWSRQTGHELVDNTEEDGKYLFWFKRTR
jgi:tRNA 2-thiouridine synthesizing protein A